jgi:hypothetical protein
MLRAVDEIEVLPPKFDDDGNPLVVEEVSKSETSKTPTMEDLMKKLEKLKAKKKKLKAKGKKGETYSSFEEEVSHKGRKGRNKHDKPSYNSMSFNYNNMPNSTAYTSVPIGKAPRFDGSNSNQWKHCMKNYLYSLHPKVWQVVCDRTDFLDEDEQPTPKDPSHCTSNLCPPLIHGQERVQPCGWPRFGQRCLKHSPDGSQKIKTHEDSHNRNA